MHICNIGGSEYKIQIQIQRIYDNNINIRRILYFVITTHLYAYFIMIELGNVGRLEDDAIITYIIKGINDKGAEGVMLYGTNEIGEFMKKLSVYEKIKQNNKPFFKINERKKVENNNNYSFKNEVNYVPKTKYNKRIQTNQIKCYRCGEDGHIRPNCKKGNVNNNTVKGEVNSITAERNRIKVKTNDVDTIALIDSGAEVSLIKLDMFEKLGIREHYKEDMVVAGIGGETDTLGFCRIKVRIQGYTYKIKVYVVNNNIMTVPVLLGANFFKVARIIFKHNKIIVTPMKINKTIRQKNRQQKNVKVASANKKQSEQENECIQDSEQVREKILELYLLYIS